jgi:hypothetical protein
MDWPFFFLLLCLQLYWKCFFFSIPAERMRTDQSGGPLDGDDKNGQLVVIHAAVTAKGNNNNNIGPT